MTFKINKTEQEWREQLDEQSYCVTRQGATEAPFTGKYYMHNEPGTYCCIACNSPLFASESKYDSGCGWPSFSYPINDTALATRLDESHNMIRTEVLCATCSAHLGHVFPDGPPPTGERYCINSAALDFEHAI